MAETFADEFAQLGLDRGGILELFRQPFYAAAHDWRGNTWVRRRSTGSSTRVFRSGVASGSSCAKAPTLKRRDFDGGDRSGAAGRIPESHLVGGPRAESSYVQRQELAAWSGDELSL